MRAPIIAAALLALLAATPALADPAAFLCAYPNVYDGDTWTCRGGPRVRLWGVNSEELHRPGGVEAKRALTRLISGKVLTCQPRGKSYDRVVALCTVDGRDVAAEMVRQGQAADWPRYSRGYYGKAGR